MQKRLTLKERLLSNPDFVSQYEKKDEQELAVRVGARVQALRVFFGVTQKELASKAKMQQPNIARIEGGKSLPSLKTLHNIAAAMDTYIVEPNFACLLEHSRQIRSIVSIYATRSALSVSSLDNQSLIVTTNSANSPEITPQHSYVS